MMIIEVFGVLINYLVRICVRLKPLWIMPCSRYNRTVTPDEVEALFMSGNPTMTTAQKQAYGE